MPVTLLVEGKQHLGALVPGWHGMCCSSMSVWWYEPYWGVNCGPNLILLLAERYSQIVSDVSVDVSDVAEVLGFSLILVNRYKVNVRWTGITLKSFAKFFKGSLIIHLSCLILVSDLVSSQSNLDVANLFIVENCNISVCRKKVVEDSALILCKSLYRHQRQPLPDLQKLSWLKILGVRFV